MNYKLQPLPSFTRTCIGGMPPLLATLNARMYHNSFITLDHIGELRRLLPNTAVQYDK
jgi:hypothetical protein